jgi:dihydroxyacid dehydratase/phosphogluconate dehydratase
MEKLYNQKYKTKEELKNAILTEAGKENFKPSIRGTSSTGRVTFRCEFADKQSAKKQQTSNNTKKRKRKNKSCGCKWEMYASLTKEEDGSVVYVVEKFANVHNGHRHVQNEAPKVNMAIPQNKVQMPIILDEFVKRIHELQPEERKKFDEYAKKMWESYYNVVDIIAAPKTKQVSPDKSNSSER